ncbi:MAG: putative hydro-lyase [Pseudomonadota bacterium]
MAVTARDRKPAFDPADPRAARAAIRAQIHTAHTAGIAPGYVQGNLCILPKSYADEFLLFCQRNPKPCPLLAMSNPGDPRLPALAHDLDIRTDVPSYRVFRTGAYVEDVRDIGHLWQDDFVAFVLGCSFSFEEAIIEAGVPIKHVERNDCVAMYVTDIDTVPGGRFAGKMVVTMRAFTPAHAIRAIQITTRFPNVHGAPVHIGKPELIGVDLDQPYLGMGVAEVGAGELPVFWACGVTPQIAVERAKPPICITHTPGHMLVTDLRNSSLAVL